MFAAALFFKKNSGAGTGYLRSVHSCDAPPPRAAARARARAPRARDNRLNLRCAGTQTVEETLWYLGPGYDYYDPEHNARQPRYWENGGIGCGVPHCPWPNGHSSPGTACRCEAKYRAKFRLKPKKPTVKVLTEEVDKKTRAIATIQQQLQDARRETRESGDDKNREIATIRQQLDEKTRAIATIQQQLQDARRETRESGDDKNREIATIRQQLDEKTRAIATIQQQ
eukprot:SAG31_NODE_1796_length_7245_cov_57.374195_9_plen_226_part_01